MQVINYTPCALNSTGIGTDATFNTDGAVAPAQLKALFDAAKTGGKIDGHDIYTAQLISADSATAILAGNGYVNDFIPGNEDLRQAYVHASYINGATIVDGKVNAGGGVAATVFTQTTHLTSAQIKSLTVAPVVIIPAPGPTEILVPISAVLRTTFGTTFYAQGNPGASQPNILRLAYDGAPTPADTLAVGRFTVNTLVPGYTAASGCEVWIPQTGVATDTGVQVGRALILVTDAYVNGTTDELIDGDGSLDITVTYIKS